MSRTVPSPFNEIISKVSEEDRLHFEANPTLPAFLRPMVEGEHYPMLSAEGMQTLVVNVLPGCRARVPVSVDISDEDAGKQASEIIENALRQAGRK